MIKYPVIIAGAGIGHMDHVSIGVLREIQSADCIIYDRLMDQRLLDFAPHAETIDAGKKKDLHKIPQDDINALLVEKYLEGKRVLRLKGGDPYVFGRGENEKMYISSADLMTRNTERRVEIACPIDSPAVRARLHDILFAMQHDTVKARVLQPDGSYQKKPSVPEPICAQDLLMQQAVSMAREQAQHASEEERGLLHWLRRLLVKD